MKTTSYLLPDFWASALVNDDATGLSDEEHETLNEWIQDHKPGFCVNVTDDPQFNTWHDARDYVLACDCLIYTFQEVNQ